MANQGQVSANVTMLLDGGLQNWEVVSSSGPPVYAVLYSARARIAACMVPRSGYGPVLAPGQSGTILGGGARLSRYRNLHDGCQSRRPERSGGVQ